MRQYHRGLLEAEVWFGRSAWPGIRCLYRTIYVRKEGEGKYLAMLFLKHITCVFEKRAVLQDLTNLGASTSNQLVQELASDRESKSSAQ